jgi:alpha-methylacyl-CoA racemase
MSGPLAGLRIVELGAIGPAPFAGAALGDLGADVVRIDRIAALEAVAEPAPRWDFYNRNKRSIAVDLKRPEGVAIAKRLVARSDALTEGYRPGVAERLGLGPDECLALNPRLVYARMTGWGQQGPLAQEAGHDIDYLALAGALHAIGTPERPVPPLNLVADLGGGAMYLALGVLAAAWEARSSGRGQVVDAAMVDGVANLMSAFQAFRQRGLWTAGRGDNLVDGGAPYYGTYETRDDRWIAVGAMEPPFYAALLEVLGLSGEPLPAQNDRARWPALRARFAAVFRTRSRDEWIAAAAGRDACLAPVLTMDEAPGHPQLAARGTFARFDGVLHPAPAPRFDRTPGALRRRAPAAGEHTREVLAELGCARDEVDAWIASGACQQASAEMVS